MLSDRVGRATEVERVYQDGETIVREGDPGREMFIIRSGGAVVRRRSGGEVTRLARGEFFGEMSVLESLPRDADVVAVGTTRVLVLGPGALLVRVRRDPSFALELLQALSGRVRALNERLDPVKLGATEEHLVVISDLHLGSPASTAHRDLLPFLDEVAQSGRALCINGDGFDLLQGSATSLATEGFPALGRLQEMAVAGVPIYYVLGNHDLVLEHLLFDLPFTVSPFLNLRSGDRLIRIEHGHLYEPFFVRHPGLYELGGRVGRAALLANADSYALWARAQQRVDDRRRVGGRQYPHHAAAIDLFTRGFDAVVFGHTHQPELVELEGGTFVNGGDWTRRRTIVTIDHGHLALAEWRPGTLLEPAPTAGG